MNRLKGVNFWRELLASLYSCRSVHSGSFKKEWGTSRRLKIRVDLVPKSLSNKTSC